MNKIKYTGCDAVNLKKASNAAMISFRQTLDYLAGTICDKFFTPDDRRFIFHINGMLSHTGVELILNFQPELVVQKKGKLLVESSLFFPILSIRAKYKTDGEMTDRLQCDIMTVLAHYGLSALYNSSGEQIIVTIG